MGWPRVAIEEMSHTDPTDFRVDAKQAAIDQWTHDPCGPWPPPADLEPGTGPYFASLLEGRRDYATWMEEVLDYRGAEGLRVLDVGHGQGMDAAQYALAGAEVTGIDLTPRHCELARAHLEGIGVTVRIVTGDAEAMPFVDREFDRVSSNGVLHHTPDMPTALKEVHRVLRPGGEARIILYNRRSVWFWFTMVLRYGILDGRLLRERSMAGVAASIGMEGTTVGARPLIRFYSPRQLRRLMRGAGFVGVRTEVRGFKAAKLPVIGPRLRGGALRWVDRTLGEYVIAYGRR